MHFKLNPGAIVLIQIAEWNMPFDNTNSFLRATNLANVGGATLAVTALTSYTLHPCGPQRWPLFD
jgi:hypothetical protein